MKTNDKDAHRANPKEGDPLGHDMPFVILLVVLAVLVIFFWFADSGHRPRGESRVGWPPPVSTKP